MTLYSDSLISGNGWIMDYRELLKRPSSLNNIEKLVQDVYENPGRFEEVYSLVFDDDENIAWRAAWACQKISEKKPDWFTSDCFRKLASLVVTKSHGGLRRGCLSVLNNLSLPDPIPVDLINACFEWMISPKLPVAVQALSMKLLFRICRQEPDFIPELKASLDDIDSASYSVGFMTSRRKILKALISN